MAHRVNYRQLANHLAVLPLEATNADLLERVSVFLADDDDYRQRIGAVIRMLPAQGNWLETGQGIDALCEFLRAENPRFRPELFAEWLMEGI